MRLLLETETGGGIGSILQCLMEVALFMKWERFAIMALIALCALYAWVIINNIKAIRATGSKT